MHLISTSVSGTLPPGTVGLIIGCSSNFKKSFEVVPGVVDSDTLGEIKVMVKALKETVQLHKSQRIAQLLLLPYLQLPNSTLKGERGKGQFGSTDTVAWVQEINDQRPTKWKGESCKVIEKCKEWSRRAGTGKDSWTSAVHSSRSLVPLTKWFFQSTIDKTKPAG